MAVFLHKEIKKFSAVNDSEAHFMLGEKRHEMQREGNEMPWRGNEWQRLFRPLRFLPSKLVRTISARRASYVV
ncbi:hypothetical protein [Pseudescherichia sp.]|uniref:hypothetical protein n=1 Tax=Pseudescherichia sp. TaxID=2055881 RepID=UPI0028ADE39B|nr:hypothetical protein [Pseudescherichia sp.]